MLRNKHTFRPLHGHFQVQATDTVLLLHYYSHVDMKYKHSLLKTMLNRAFKLSSNWQFFSSRVRSPKGDLHSFALPSTSHTKHHWVFRWNEGDGEKTPRATSWWNSRRNFPALQRSEISKLREQLGNLSRKINTEIHPVFTSHKIKNELKAKELKSPIINQENVVYFELWSVWCRSCRLFKPTPTSTCGGT